MRYRKIDCGGRTRLWRDDVMTERDEEYWNDRWDIEHSDWPDFEEEPDEIWAVCEDFPDYEISSKGRLWSNISGHYIRFQVNVQNGYEQTKILDEFGRKHHVYKHTLISKAFVGDLHPKGKRLVRHLDDDRRNNSPFNLEWGTQSENVEDSRRNGHMHLVGVILENIETGELIEFDSSRDAARYLGVNPSCISMALKGRVKTTRGHRAYYKTR